MVPVIGNVIKSEFEMQEDPGTGARVVRMTGLQHTCHHIYPTLRSTTSEGQFLLYFRELNDRRQLFAMNLETGNSMQLTSGDNVDDYHAAFSADNQRIFYLQENSLRSMGVHDLLRTELYAPDDGWLIREFDFSEDDRYAIVLETVKTSANVTMSGMRDWSTFALDSLSAPRCRIIRIDFKTRRQNIVVEEDCWLGKPYFRPGDPSTILYCHEGPYNMIDARMWLVNSDGTGKRCCRKQGPGTVLTSEFWFPDGRELGFLYWKTGGDRGEEVHAIDPDTLEERVLCGCPAFAHCAVSPDGRYLVGDALSTNDPVHLRDEVFLRGSRRVERDDDFLYLVDLKTGEQMRLCHHGASFLSKYGAVFDSEAHPVFSRDGRSVIFASDIEGVPCIYRVKLARFLWEHEAQADEMYAYGLTATF